MIGITKYDKILHGPISYPHWFSPILYDVSYDIMVLLGSYESHNS